MRDLDIENFRDCYVCTKPADSENTLITGDDRQFLMSSLEKEVLVGWPHIKKNAV